MLQMAQVFVSKSGSNIGCHVAQIFIDIHNAECMKLTGLARNTYYKYKRQIRAELIAEQDLPKGASIFYEPPKSF